MQMLVDLVAALSAAAVVGNPGVTVPLQQIAPGYMVSSSCGRQIPIPRQQTAVFADNHKIFRQSIVVRTKDPTAIELSVVSV